MKIHVVMILAAFLSSSKSAPVDFPLQTLSFPGSPSGLPFLVLPSSATTGILSNLVQNGLLNPPDSMLLVNYLRPQGATEGALNNALAGGILNGLDLGGLLKGVLGGLLGPLLEAGLPLGVVKGLLPSLLPPGLLPPGVLSPGILPPGLLNPAKPVTPAPVPGPAPARAPVKEVTDTAAAPANPADLLNGALRCLLSGPKGVPFLCS